MEVLKLTSSILETIVVDCYVDLELARPGLGRYLFNELNEQANVIGVAKSRFRNSDIAIEILRGNSLRPLFITAAGVNLDVAANWIQNMAGENRIPKILQLVDSLARNGKLLP